MITYRLLMYLALINREQLRPKGFTAINRASERLVSLLYNLVGV